MVGLLQVLISITWSASIVGLFFYAFGGRTRAFRFERIGFVFGFGSIGFLLLSWFLLRISKEDDVLIDAMVGEQHIMLACSVAAVVSLVRKSTHRVSFRRLLIGAAVAISLVVAWLVIGNSAADRKEAKVNELWRDVLDPMDQVLERFPKTSANDSATKLQNLASGFGINLIPRTSVARDQPEKDQEEEFQKIKNEIVRCLYSHISRPGHTEQSVPQSVQEYMEKHDVQIHGIVNHLLAGEPRWDSNIIELNHAPFPNLIGIIQLQSVLCLDALLNNDAGRLEKAQDELEASWNLNESLLSRPEEICQLIAFRVLRMQSGVLRQMHKPDTSWEQRMGRKDLIRSYLHAEEANVWVFQEEVRRGNLLKDPTKSQGHRPIWEMMKAEPEYQRRLMVSEYSEKKAVAMRELVNREVCSPRRVLSYGEISAMFRPSNWIGEVAYTDPARGWNQMARTLLDMELTARVLEIHRTGLKQSRDFESSLCPQQRWKYNVVNGVGTLSFTKSINWEELDPDCCNGDSNPRQHSLERPLTYSEEVK